MAVRKDDKFYELVKAKLDEEYDRLYKEKFTEAYMITYSTCGDGDKAEEIADDEAASYAEHMLEIIEREIEEDIEEMLEKLEQEME